MSDERKTRQELLEKLDVLRSRVAQLEQAGGTKEYESLRESERTFRTIFDSAADGILLADVETKKFYIGNEVICRMLGFDPAEIKNLGVMDIHPAEDIPYVIEQFDKQARGELTLAKDIPVKRKDGCIFYADVNSFPITLDGKTYLMGIFRDITERKKAEDALRESEERFHIIFEGAAEGILLLDTENGKIVDFNEAACKNLGYTREEFQKLTIADVEAIESSEEIAEHIQKIIQKRGDTFETKHRTKDGEIRDVLVSSGVASIRGRKHLVSIWNDVTDIRRAEEKLAVRDQAIKSSQSAVAVADVEGNIKFVNPAFLNLWGYADAGEVLGRHCTDFWQNRDQARKIMQQVQEEEKAIGELTASRKDGGLVDVQVCASLITDDAQRVIGMLAWFVDITESRRKEQELTLYRGKMVQAEHLASLGTLSATVAHELTQPLTVISLSVGSALSTLEATSAPETVKKKLKDSIGQLSNITSIIDRFRRFARRSSEKIVTQVDLKAVAERIVNLLNENARRAGMALHLKRMDKLPPVYSSEKDLEQLFFALIDNAMRAAEGKKDRELVISGAVKDEHIELQFCDNCGGIVPEDLDKIFEPFFTTRPAGQGTGLGLCIVQDIVSRAGGKVRVKSKLGKGSTFFVTLPINKG